MRNLLLLGIAGVASASCPTGQHFNDKLNVCEIDKPEGGCTSLFPYPNDWVTPNTCTTVELPPDPSQAGNPECTWEEDGTVAEDCLLQYVDSSLTSVYTHCRKGQKFYIDDGFQTCGPPCTI